MSEIRRITGSDDFPVAWTEFSYPVSFRVGVWGVEYPDGLPTSTYKVSTSYAVPIKPYKESILEPEWEVFI